MEEIIVRCLPESDIKVYDVGAEAPITVSALETELPISAVQIFPKIKSPEAIFEWSEDNFEALGWIKFDLNGEFLFYKTIMTAANPLGLVANAIYRVGYEINGREYSYLLRADGGDDGQGHFMASMRIDNLIPTFAESVGGAECVIADGSHYTGNSLENIGWGYGGAILWCGVVPGVTSFKIVSLTKVS